MKISYYLLFINIIFNFKVQAQINDTTSTPYYFDIDNKKTFFSFEDMSSCSKSFLYTVMLFDFRASDGAASGPFIIEPQITYFSKDKNIILNSRLFWTPISQKLFEDLSDDTNFGKVEFEVILNLNLFKKIESVEKKFIVNTESDGLTDRYYYINVVSPQIKQKTIRFSTLYRQASIAPNRKRYGEEYIGKTINTFKANGYRQFVCGLGLSSIKSINVKYNTQNYNKNIQSYKYFEVYADMLYAPLNNLYGHVYESYFYSSSTGILGVGQNREFLYEGKILDYSKKTEFWCQTGIYNKRNISIKKNGEIFWF